MSDQMTPSGGVDEADPFPRRTGRLLGKLPYLVVLILATLGVAYTSITGSPLYGYWELLGLAVGLACIVIGWRQTDDKRARRQIVVTQALHWAAFLIAMNIILWPSVNTFLNGPATGLALMLLLALGTFVAGVHVSADIAILGIALALTVPAIAWLKKSALLIALVGLVIGGLAVLFRPSSQNRDAT